MTSLAIPLAPSPSLVGLVLITAIVTILLFVERPRISRRIVVSFVPWMIVGSALSVLSTLIFYPGSIQPLVGTGAYLSTYVIVGVVWFAMLQFSARRETNAALADYLGAMGVGAAVVLVAFVILYAGPVSVLRLVWLLVVPVAAGFAAFVVLFLLGLRYIDAPAYTGVVGALVVFGQTVDGISTALGAGAFDTLGHTYLSWTVLDWIASAQAAGLVGDDRLLVWTWGLVWVKMLIAALAVILLTPVARERPSLGYLLLGLIAAVGITGGVADLLLIAVGGSP